MNDWQSWPADDGADHSVTGRILRRPHVHAASLGNERDVFVCLPPGHGDPTRRFPVLYMQDGQNLFDRALAFGGQEWHVDETLAAEAGHAEAIVVGIANAGPARIHEYSPWVDGRLGGGRGDAYLDFVTNELKPAIDADFPTLPDRANTFIAGSSMGGLIALHGFLTRHEVFGGVAALSPSLWFAGRAIFEVLADAPKREGRIYIDAGTREGSGTLMDVARLREALLEKGYRRNVDLLTVVEGDGRHSEEAWARRFPRALRFLLGVEVAEPGPAPSRSALRLRRSAGRKRKRPS
jgi:predicted alpha/beta superfamily hydrolase